MQTKDGADNTKIRLHRHWPCRFGGDFVAMRQMRSLNLIDYANDQVVARCCAAASAAAAASFEVGINDSRVVGLLLARIDRCSSS